MYTEEEHTTPGTIALAKTSQNGPEMQNCRWSDFNKILIEGNDISVDWIDIARRVKPAESIRI